MINFLWSQITKIQEARKEGNYALAIKLSKELVAFLPEDLQKKFKNKVVKIELLLKELEKRGYVEKCS